MDFVASVENFIVEHFLDGEIFEFLAEGVSLYRPWVGSPYWSEEEMLQLMEDFVKELPEWMDVREQGCEMAPGSGLP